MKENAFISVVVYISNQENTIAKFLLNLDSYLDKNFKFYEIVLVDNNSLDNTVEVVKTIRRKLKGNTTLVSMAWKQNIEMAMLAGVDLAVGDLVVEIESINSDFNLNIIKRLYIKSLKGFDIVSATPSDLGTSTSKFFYKVFNKISSLDISLETEPVRVITRRALNAALRSKEKLRYRKVLYRQTGFSTAVLRYKSNRKRFSNKTLGEKVSLGIEMLLSFSSFGTNFAFFLSVFFLFISVLIAIYTVYIYITFKQVIPGWTTTMLSLSFGFSGLFLIIGILVKYMTMILTEVKDKPRYTIQSVERIK